MTGKIITVAFVIAGLCVIGYYSDWMVAVGLLLFTFGTSQRIW